MLLKVLHGRVEPNGGRHEGGPRRGQAGGVAAGAMSAELETFHDAVWSVKRGQACAASVADRDGPPASPMRITTVMTVGSPVRAAQRGGLPTRCQRVDEG